MIRAAEGFARAASIAEANREGRRSERLLLEQARALQKASDHDAARDLLDTLYARAKQFGKKRWMMEIEYQRRAIVDVASFEGDATDLRSTIRDGILAGLVGGTLEIVIAESERRIDEHPAALADAWSIARSVGHLRFAVASGPLLAERLNRLGRFREALEVAELAIEDAESARDSGALLRASAARAIASLGADGIGEGAATHELVTRLRIGGENSRANEVRERLVRTLLEARRLDESREEIVAWRADAQSDRSLDAADRAILMKSELLRLEGLLDEARAVLIELADRAPTPGFARARLTASRLIGWLDLDERKWIDAIARFERVLAIAKAQDDLEIEFHARIGRIRCERLSGEPKNGNDDVRHLERALAVRVATTFDRIGEDFLETAADESMLYAIAWRDHFAWTDTRLSANAASLRTHARRQELARLGFSRTIGRVRPERTAPQRLDAGSAILCLLAPSLASTEVRASSSIIGAAEGCLLNWLRRSGFFAAMRDDCRDFPVSHSSDRWEERIDPRDHQIIDYHRIEDRLVAAVYNSRGVRMADLGSWTDIRTTTEAWLGALDRDDPDEFTLARAAFDSLMAPLWSNLSATRSVVIVAEDFLEQVPFDALAMEEADQPRRLAETFTWSFTPTHYMPADRFPRRSRGSRRIVFVDGSNETRNGVAADAAAASTEKHPVPMDPDEGASGRQVPLDKITRVGADARETRRFVTSFPYYAVPPIVWHVDAPAIVDRASGDASGFVLRDDRRLTITDIDIRPSIDVFVTFAGSETRSSDGRIMRAEDLMKDILARTHGAALVAAPCRDRDARDAFLAEFYELMLSDEPQSTHLRTWKNSAIDNLFTVKRAWIEKHGAKHPAGVWARCNLWRIIGY